MRSSWYHSNDAKRNLCVMLFSHFPINDSSCYLNTLCYKPFRILQRVTKSQKAHISINEGLQKLHNIFDIGPNVFQRWSRVAGTSCFADQIFWEQLIYCSSFRRYIILTAIHSPHKYLRATLISNGENNGEI